MGGTVDLFQYCRERNVVSERSKLIGLDKLYAIVAGRRLAKPEDIRCGSWDNELSSEQVDYAALDAYAAIDIYQRVKDHKVYGKCVMLGEHAVGEEVYLKKSGIYCTGVLSDTPPIGETVTLQEPPKTAGATPRQLKFVVKAGQRILAVQRVDRPSWTPPLYSQSLRHIVATVDDPFLIIVSSDCLYTRPPLEDRQRLPPRDVVALENIDNLGSELIAADAGDALARRLEDEAQALIDEEDVANVNAELGLPPSALSRLQSSRSTAERAIRNDGKTFCIWLRSLSADGSPASRIERASSSAIELQLRSIR